ncbi:MAG: helix-turn-helix domain-containing protein [Bacteroidota bacterium]
MNNPAILEKLQSIETMLLEQNTRFLSLSEAATYLNVSESFLYKAIAKRTIPFSKPNGKLIYFRQSDLNAWIENGSSLTTIKGE